MPETPWASYLNKTSLLPEALARKGRGEYIV